MQHKRVALPYIFGKYCLPMMKKHFRGEIKLYHVFHTHHSDQVYMASNRILGADRVDLVKKYIADGKFRNAVILSHETVCDYHPLVPSLKLAAKIALEENADFHLWLEDDAIVYDLECGFWATLLGSADAGLYVDTDEKQQINTAYFLSTPELDRRYSLMLREFQKDISISTNRGLWKNFKSHGSLTEHMAWRAARRPVYMGPCKAYRHHAYPKYQKTGTMVRDWLKKTIPDITTADLDLLALDFKD